jgi:hypothetical protein
VILTLGFVAGETSSRAGETGVCVVARVPESFSLPDGSIQSAGGLRLCVDRAFTPVLSLLRIRADGGGTSLAMSRRARAEATSDSVPLLVFHRLPGAPLELAGYVLPFDRVVWHYSLRRAGTWPPVDPMPIGWRRSADESVTVIAAREM